MMIYLDIETLPRDGVPFKTDAFPPPPCHEIVCMVAVKWNGEAWERHTWHGPQITSGVLNILRGQIIGWNIRGFDLPVLMWHAARYRHTKLLDACTRWVTTSRYAHDFVRDVQDIASGYGAAPRCSLDVAAKCLGLRGKGEMDGSKVADAWERDPAAVVTYCTEDVVQTAVIDLVLRAAKTETLAALWSAAAQWTPALVAGSTWRP